MILVALAGVGLNELDLSQSKNQSIALIGLAATVFAVALISRIIKKVLKNETQGSPQHDKPTS